MVTRKEREALNKVFSLILCFSVSNTKDFLQTSSKYHPIILISFLRKNSATFIPAMGADTSILVSETPRGMPRYHTVKQVKEDLNCPVAVL